MSSGGILRPRDSKEKENVIITFCYVIWLITNIKVVPLARRGQPHVYKNNVPNVIASDRDIAGLGQKNDNGQTPTKRMGQKIV